MTEIRLYTAGVFTILFLFISGCAVKKPVTESDKIQPPGMSYDYLWVIQPVVNIRSNPSANSPQVGILNDGDSVFVITNKSGWYQIRTPSHQEGWIRSDLLGPQSLSLYPKAVKFADSLKKAENVNLFFDKRLHHRRIYLTFPSSFYGDREHVIAAVERISADYQAIVFEGDIAVIVMNPATEEVSYTFEQSGTVNSDVRLPVAPFGKIIDARLSPETAELTYIVRENISENTFLNSARDMAGIYPISYREIVLTFLNENNECKFWYKEDSNGELFKFDSCP